MNSINVKAYWKRNFKWFLFSSFYPYNLVLPLFFFSFPFYWFNPDKENIEQNLFIKLEQRKFSISKILLKIYKIKRVSNIYNKSIFKNWIFSAFLLYWLQEKVFIFTAVHKLKPPLMLTVISQKLIIKSFVFFNEICMR